MDKKKVFVNEIETLIAQATDSQEMVFDGLTADAQAFLEDRM